jgi:hypothetical protein
MNDMIDYGGMLRGWTMVWHTELVWLLPMFLMSVAAVALMESLIRSGALFAAFNRLRNLSAHTTPVLAAGLVPVSRTPGIAASAADIPR